MTNGDSRPFISRETRLLFVTIVVSVAALWVLARIRFQERASTPDPVPPVLAQLRSQPTFDDLATSLAEIRPRIAASVLAVDRGTSVLRIDREVGVGFVDMAFQSVLAFDRASGLAVVRIPADEVAALDHWSPRRLDYPRFLIAAEPSTEGVSLRPVFLGALHRISTPLWEDTIWAVPSGTDLLAGRFVFTTGGAFVGVTIEQNGQQAIVPGATLLHMANRLRAKGDTAIGEIGVSVEAMSPAVASASAAQAGMVVTWVDPNGPGAEKLSVLDVIESVDGQALLTPEHWEARVSRLGAGDAIALRVRRNGQSRDVTIIAVPPVTPSAQPELGLTLRNMSRIGVEVLRVQPSSAAARAAIQVGDVITSIAGQNAPTAAQVTRAFSATKAHQPLLVAFTRHGVHHVTALE